MTGKPQTDIDQNRHAPRVVHSPWRSLAQCPRRLTTFRIVVPGQPDFLYERAAGAGSPVSVSESNVSADETPAADQAPNGPRGANRERGPRSFGSRDDNRQSVCRIRRLACHGLASQTSAKSDAAFNAGTAAIHHAHGRQFSHRFGNRGPAGAHRVGQLPVRGSHIKHVPTSRGASPETFRQRARYSQDSLLHPWVRMSGIPDVEVALQPLGPMRGLPGCRHVPPQMHGHFAGAMGHQLEMAHGGAMTVHEIAVPEQSHQQLRASGATLTDRFIHTPRHRAAYVAGPGCRIACVFHVPQPGPGGGPRENCAGNPNPSTRESENAAGRAKNAKVRREMEMGSSVG